MDSGGFADTLLVVTARKGMRHSICGHTPYTCFVFALYLPLRWVCQFCPCGRNPSNSSGLGRQLSLGSSWNEVVTACPCCRQASSSDNGAHAQNIVDFQLGLLAAVHELSNVHYPCGNQQLLCPLLKSVEIMKDHFPEGSVTIGVMNAFTMP